MNEGGTEGARRIEPELEEGVIGAIHPERQGPKILRGDERLPVLAELNRLDIEIEELQEEIGLMNPGLEDTQVFEETKMDTLERVGMNLAKRLAKRTDLRKSKRKQTVEVLDDDTRYEIATQIGMARMNRDSKLERKAELEAQLYTPEELRRMQEIEEDLGRRVKWRY
ncbi:MAG: hypothetical protein AAB660_02200 [Patescibacteria group bacterium]